MMRLIRPFLSVIVLLLPLAFAIHLHAQFGAGIQGTVTDQSGAAVKGAAVTATNQATGVVSTATSNDSGVFSVQFLPPGKYTVDVDASSFKKTTMRDVVVQAETPRGLNVVLKPGATKESVTVTAEAAPIQTENGSVSGNIDSQQVEQLPSFGRDP